MDKITTYWQEQGLLSGIENEHDKKYVAHSAQKIIECCEEMNLSSNKMQGFNVYEPIEFMRRLFVEDREKIKNIEKFYKLHNWFYAKRTWYDTNEELKEVRKRYFKTTKILKRLDDIKG